MMLRLPAASFLAIAGSAVQAQPATGTLVPAKESSAMVQGALARKGHSEPTDSAFEGGRTMARCMVGNHPKEADAMLAAADMPSFEAAYRRNKRHIVNCLSLVEVYGDTASLEMRFDHNTLRALLAEAKFRRMPPVGIGAVEYAPNAAGSEWVAEDDASQATLRVADCLAARQPAAVAQIVASSPASPVEAEGFTALMPHVAGCLDRNVRLSTRKTGLRLALASAMDRRMRQPAQSTGGK